MNWDKESVIYLAGVYGLGSTFFSLIQFLPQIKKTFVNKVNIILNYKKKKKKKIKIYINLIMLLIEYLKLLIS